MAIHFYPMGLCILVVVVWVVGIAIMIKLYRLMGDDSTCDWDEEACTVSSLRIAYPANGTPTGNRPLASVTTPLNRRRPALRNNSLPSSGYLSSSTEYGTLASEDVFISPDIGSGHTGSIFYSAPSNFRDHKTQSWVAQQGSIIRDGYTDTNDNNDQVSTYSSPCPTRSPVHGARLTSVGSLFSLFTLSEAGAAYDAELRSSHSLQSSMASLNSRLTDIESLASSESRVSLVIKSDADASYEADMPFSAFSDTTDTSRNTDHDDLDMKIEGSGADSNKGQGSSDRESA